MVSLKEKPAVDEAIKKKNPKAVKRPSNDTLDLFWTLADLQVDKRVQAVRKLVKSTEHEGHAKYVFDRLIRGLLSSRAAARVGFGSALSQLHVDQVQVLLDRADEVYAEEENLNSVSLANIFLCAALLRNASVKQVPESVEMLMKRLWTVRNTNARLGHAVVAVLVGLVEQLDDSVWQNAIELEQLTIDGDLDVDVFWLVLVLHQHRPTLVSNVKLLKQLGKLDQLMSFLAANKDKFLNEERQVVHPVCAQLMYSTSCDHQKHLTQLWTQFFEPATFANTSPKWMVYGAGIIIAYTNMLSKNGRSGPIDVFFTRTTLQRIQSSLIDRKTVAFTGGAINNLLECINRLLPGQTNKQLLSMLDAIDEHVPTIDRVSGTHLITSIVRRLEASAANQYLKQLFDRNAAITDEEGDVKHNMVLDKMLCIYGKHSVDVGIRYSVLKHLCDVGLINNNTSPQPLCRKRNNLRLNDLMKMQLQIKVTQSGRATSFRLTDTDWQADVNLIKYMHQNIAVDDEDTLKVLVECVQLVVSNSEHMTPVGTSLGTLLLALFVRWHITHNQAHIDMIQEVIELHAKAVKAEKKSKSDAWLEQQVDLLMNVMSLDQEPLLRATIPFVLCPLADRLKLAHLQPLLDIIDIEKTDALLQEDDAEEEESPSDEDEDSEEEREQPMEDVNEALISAVKQALGGALDDSDQQAEEVDSDFDDDAMFRLDDKLAQAFKTHVANKQTTNSKGEAKKDNRVSAAQVVFRARVADLLIALVGGETMQPVVLLQSMPLVLAACNHSVRSKADNNLTAKLQQVIRVWMQSNPSTDVVDSDEYCQAFDAFVSCSSTMTNPKLHHIAAGCLSTLVRHSLRQSESTIRDALMERYNSLIKSYFDEPNEFIPAPLIDVVLRNHTAALVPTVVPTLREYAFQIESDMRPFKQTQSLSWMAMLVKPNCIDFENKPGKKVWKKFVSAFEEFITTVISSIIEWSKSDKGQEPPKGLTASYISNVFGLTLSVLRNCHPKRPMPLMSEAEWQQTYLHPLADNALWFKLPKKQVLIQACVRVTGKSPVQFAKYSLSLLGGKLPKLESMEVDDMTPEDGTLDTPTAEAPARKKMRKTE